MESEGGSSYSFSGADSSWSGIGGGSGNSVWTLERGVCHRPNTYLPEPCGFDMSAGGRPSPDLAHSSGRPRFTSFPESLSAEEMIVGGEGRDEFIHEDVTRRN